MPTRADIYYHCFEGSASNRRSPVVLIHGAGGNHLYWPAEIRRLKGCRVYALDLPGHGKSSGQARQTIAAYANVVKDWISALGISSVIIAGHSMGSAIGLTLALDHPEIVDGLVLLGAGARLRVSPQILQSAENQSTFLNAVRRLVESSFDASAPMRLKELAAKRMAEVRASVLYADLQACDNFDVIGRLNEISKPTLILCGSTDQMTPPRFSYYLAEKIQDSQLQIIQEAGHMVQLEKPESVADAIWEFVSRIPYLQ